MNYNDKAIARHIERAERLCRRNERRAECLTACGIIAATALAAVLLAGAVRTEREYGEKTVTVRSGDTLWSVAEQYCPDNMDKREYVHIIETDNDCTANIRNGDILTVRIYEEK